MTDDYDDIMNLPHHVSGVRRQMPRANRAAQFMPFAALTGYDDAVRETARLTDRKIELDEDTRARLDEKLLILVEHAAEHPEVEILCFRADGRKEGGTYIPVSGRFKRLDESTREMILADQQRILLENVLDISCDLFAAWNIGE